MKKFIAMILMLSFVLAIPAFAEEVEATDINWNEEAEQTFIDAGYVGTWTTLEDVNCKLIVPEGFVDEALTDEDKANNLVHIFVNQETGATIKVFDSQIDSMEDLASIGNALHEKNPDQPIQFAHINGAGAVINAIPTDDVVNTIFDLGNHRYYQIMFTGMLAEQNQLMTLCMASIQFANVG